VSVVDPVSLFAELKRRRVFRALVGYGIVAFAVLQIIEPVMHGFHWSDAVLSYAVVALAIGFPVVVGLAWNRASALRASGLHGTRLGLTLFIIGALAAAPGLTWYFLLRRLPGGPGMPLSTPAPSPCCPS